MQSFADSLTEKTAEKKQIWIYKKKKYNRKFQLSADENSYH